MKTIITVNQCPKFYSAALAMPKVMLSGQSGGALDMMT